MSQSAVAAAAALAIATALVWGVLGYDPVALAIIAVALALAIIGALTTEPPSTTSRTRWKRGAFAAMRVALVPTCAWHLFAKPTLYSHERPTLFVACAAAALLICGTYLINLPARLASLRVPLVIVLFLAMGTSAIRITPSPPIDVWWFQQYAASLIARGQNPYEFAYPNIYGGTHLFGPDVVVGSAIPSYPYMPLTFLLGAPVVEILLDVRYLMLGAMAATAVLAWRRTRSAASEAVVLLFLFQPRAFFVLEQSWNEPLVVLAFAATLAAIASSSRSAKWTVGIAAGVLLSTKQYTPILALPLVLAVDARERRRAVAVAVAVLAVTTAPFVAWNAQEFWRDVVVMQFRQPFRQDALSFLSLIEGTGGAGAAVWGFVACAAVMTAALRRPPTAAGAARIAGASFLAFIAFNKQAFANYYWACSGILALAAAMGFAGGETAGSRSTVIPPLPRAGR